MRRHGADVPTAPGPRGLAEEEGTVGASAARQEAALVPVRSANQAELEGPLLKEDRRSRRPRRTLVPMRALSLLLLVACASPIDSPSTSVGGGTATGPSSSQERETPAEDPAPSELGPRATVKLVILGEFPEALIEAISTGLVDELQVEVKRLPTRPLPRSAYYPPRRRYRADRLLDDELAPLLVGEPRSTKVIGFTSVDISTTAHGHRDWGVFGLGHLGGRASVISLFRLQRELRDDAHLRHRVVTVATHEVGHTLGLEHCTEPRCLMNDAHGSIGPVDDSTGHLGSECRAEVEARAPQAPR